MISLILANHPLRLESGADISSAYAIQNTLWSESDAAHEFNVPVASASILSSDSNAKKKSKASSSSSSLTIAHGDKSHRAGTLVIVSTVAIRQWHTEIVRFTTGGSVKVLIYHGGDRGSQSVLSELQHADIVITSYKVT